MMAVRSALLLASSAVCAHACESTNVIVNSVVSQFPKCFESCPAACPSAELVFPAYMAQGTEAAKNIICADLDPWLCTVEATNCAGLLAGAKGLGIEIIPDSVAEAHLICAVTGACDNNQNSTKELGESYKACFEACDGLCDGMEAAFKILVDQGKEKAAMEVCAKRETWNCPLTNQACSGMLDEAAKSGLTLPKTTSEADLLCLSEKEASSAAGNGVLGKVTSLFMVMALLAARRS
eukprot:gb/GFBE01046893.1/.p1 GENE.gb/GFBE01046893.1/~~gb/GFBE01046893.1/.p1  ORF type:complete len:237 (+),score=59.71 gb/GFBE01046893.1/:1-711(+)